MYILTNAGRVYFDGLNEAKEVIIRIEISMKYRKALKNLKEFSHAHIFYTTGDDEKNRDKVNGFQASLHCIIVRLGKVNVTKGEVTAISGMIPTETFNNDIGYELFDIKPYFPCDDSVDPKVLYAINHGETVKQENNDRLKEVMLKEDERKKNLYSTNTGINLRKSESDGSYQVEACGVIRNTHGRVFIQYNQDSTFPDINNGFIRVFWWFNKFDSDSYRRITECNPPYENAPRTGVFASRSPVRPNPLAVTLAYILKVDEQKKRIYINSIESFDKTPCLGISAYIMERDCEPAAEVPEWLRHWPRFYKPENTIDMIGEYNTERKDEDFLMEKDKYSTSAFIYTYRNNKKRANPCSSTSCKKTLPASINVTGARENNLKGVNVSIPYGKIIAVVGVSGSGKSSLVNDTIYAECHRRMEYLNNERNFLQKPRMEHMTGCIPAVIISQKEMRGNSQSTIGTYTNVYDYLRMIYASVGIRHCPDCGNEIVPLSEDRIINLLENAQSSDDMTDQKADRERKMEIYSLNRHLIDKGSIQESVRAALSEGNGAMYVRHDNHDILMQTRQKCYHCDKLMFEMTPSTFSFIDPESRCPLCNGTGEIVIPDEKKLISHPELSLLDGASSFYGKLRSFITNPNANWMKGQVFGLAEALGEDISKPWNELSDEYRDKLLNGAPGMLVTFCYDNKKNGRKGEITREITGLKHIIQSFYDENDGAASVLKYMTSSICKKCHGERLSKEGRRVTIGNMRYPEAAAMSFEKLIEFCEELADYLPEEQYTGVAGAADNLRETAEAAVRLGIGYLTLDRGTTALSGGEGQRIKLLAAMQNHMTGILYVFDEPSKGLHPKDYKKVADVINELKAEGNTIIMVEHNEDMISIADNVIEIGPEAGERGGRLTHEGSFREIFDDKVAYAYASRKAGQSYDMINMDNLCFRNLKNISVQFPKQALTCICGVSGCGKSSLMRGEIFTRIEEGHDFSGVILADQQPLGRSSKSVIATYSGVMDYIREIYAKTEQAVDMGLDEGSFSFNSEAGQCPSCKGEGRIKLKYLEDAFIPCQDCRGKRYRKEILRISHNGKSIDEVLSMSVEEAAEFYKENEDIYNRLKLIIKVGMGYLRMGQNTTTLSGGEASRLKLARELMSAKRSNTLYLLDEPTTGLHFSDIDHMLVLIDELIEDGNTVIAIEHNKQFMRAADWRIELGPGAGDEGGKLIYCGRA